MSEHQLGRVNLTMDDSVAFIETDESEDDLSDHSAHMVISNLRRQNSQQGRTPPSRERNMSSTSASRRFRRTSSKPQQTSSPTTSTSNLWQARGGEGVVDQSVNLMDAKTMPYDPEVGSGRGAPRARPGMASAYGQKSMVDVFLTDDRPQTRGSSNVGGSGKYGVEDLSKQERNRKCINFLVLAVPLVVIVILLCTVPAFGVVGNKSNNNNNNNNPAPQPIEPPQEIVARVQPQETQAPTDAPQTPAPTEAPQSEEVLIEEEAALPEQPEQAEEPEPEETAEDGDMDLAVVPQVSRLKAFEFFVIDQDVTEEAQLNIMGSPAKKALHWITQKDAFQLEIPGLDDVTTSNAEAEHALLQRYALAVFYYSVQAASTTTNQAENAGRMLQGASDQELANRDRFDQSWLSAEPTCMWYGVTCDDDFESITKLALPGHFLQGTIPRELLVGAAMPYLKHLDLAKNQLSGPLPVVTQERKDAGLQLRVPPPASTLKVLELAENRLTGSVNNMMGMPNLTKVDLSRNQFTGKIPDTIMDLSLLEDLRLSNNRLSGPVPAESLGELTGLRVLRLDDNSLTEDLPMTLYTLSNLRELTLSANRFGGQIPDSYGDLTSLQLLYIDGNEIEGKVPTELGRLTKLAELQLDGNELTGQVPEEICNLRDGTLSRLETDCVDGEIVCDCCSDCY